MTPTPRRAIAFIHWGAFSHINPSFAAALQDVLSDFEIDKIDVHELAHGKDPPLSFKFAACFHAFRDYGKLLLLRREKLRGPGGCLIRSRFYFTSLRTKLEQRLAARDYVFSIQTTSRFNGSVHGIPHFVYTDFTELECLNLPDFRPRDLFPERWIELERCIYRDAAAIFGMSNVVCQSLVEKYACPASKVICAYAGPNVSPRPDFRSTPDRYQRKDALFVGVDWERKGGPELLEAFERTLDDHPSATLTIVGCSPRISVPNCRVVGRLSLSEMRSYYERASLFVLPTRRESFGISFIEAMAHKLPVIGTNVGAVPEFVLEGKTGHVVPVRDVDALTLRLGELLGDAEKCRQFGEAGHGSVMARYTWPHTASAVKSGIESVLGPIIP